MAKASDTSWKKRMVSQPSAPTGVLRLRQSPDTAHGWGVSGAQFSELHPLSSFLLVVIYLPVQLGFVSKGISFPGMGKDRRQKQAGRRGSRLCKITTQCHISERKTGTPMSGSICPTAEELRGISCCSLSICTQAGNPAARQVPDQCGVNEGVQGYKWGGWRRAGGGLDAADWNCTTAAGHCGGLTSLGCAQAREHVLAGIV